MGSFLKTASKQVADVRNFLRDAAGGNSIKYVPEKGAKHIIYIPYTSEEVIDEAGASTVVKKPVAIQGAVHEWSTADGKFKATVCLKDVVRKADDGTVLNDGTCPFCDRITDAWDIYNYRKNLEEASCQLTGEQRKTHLDKTFSTFADERKAKDARNYMYMLIVKFRTKDDGSNIIGADGLPEYDLKVMKLSASRVEKIQQQIMNSGSEFEGSELIFSYPTVDDRRLLVSQSTTTPVFPNNMVTVKFPALINKINEDVAKFDWDGIEKSFPEWSGMTSAAAKETTDAQFEQWDKYKKELTTNPQAKYLEYVVATPTAKPSLGGAEAGAPVIPTIPTIPNVAPAPAPAAAAPAMPNIPVGAPTPAPAPAPGVPTPGVDPNAVFGNGAAAPSITV